MVRGLGADYRQGLQYPLVQSDRLDSCLNPQRDKLQRCSEVIGCGKMENSVLQTKLYVFTSYI